MIQTGNYNELIKQLKRKIILRIAVIISVLVVLYLWVFFIFANIDNFWGIFSKKGANTYQKREAPLQTPFLNSIPKATNKETIEISGSSVKSAEVTLFQNEQTIEKTTPDEAGKFKFVNIKIQPSKNDFYVVAELNSKKSDRSNSLTITFDKEKPKLIINKPNNGDSYGGRNSNIIIEGTSEPEARVFINEGLAIVNDDGAFSFTYTAQEGQNEIKIKAIDVAGNETSEKVNFEYSPD